MDQFKKRVVMSVCGVLLSGVCVGVFKQSLMGPDPFTVLVSGMGSVTHLNYGNIYIIVTGIFLLAVYLIDKHFIGIATVINLVCIGYTAELTQRVLSEFAVTQMLWMRILLLAAGIVINSLAASIYFAADMGVSAYDAIALMISARLKLPLRSCRIATDFLCVMLGFLCKTTIGVGTLFTALCMGPMIQWFNEHFTRPLLYGSKEKHNEI
jgi:uncharacterized protein